MVVVTEKCFSFIWRTDSDMFLCMLLPGHGCCMLCLLNNVTTFMFPGMKPLFIFIVFKI